MIGWGSDIEERIRILKTDLKNLEDQERYLISNKREVEGLIASAEQEQRQLEDTTPDFDANEYFWVQVINGEATWNAGEEEAYKVKKALRKLIEEM